MAQYNYYLADPFAGLPIPDVGVCYVRDDLKQAYRDWYRLLHDVLHGSPAVKARKEIYLPYPNADHLSEDEQTARSAKLTYDNYVMRAQFFNTTARTATGFTGLVFNKEPDIDLPKRYEPHIHNVDGNGNGLIEQAQEVVHNILGYGRGALRVDYGSNYTAKDVQDGRAVPTIQFIAWHDLINWRETLVGNRKKLTLAMVVERSEVDDAGYSTTRTVRLREYRLVKGRLVVKLWGSNPTPDFVFYPTKDDGTPMDYIPIYPIGVTENSFKIDVPPMLDLAEVNIGHYRNSADDENSAFIVGQPTYAAIGLTEEWLKDQLDGHLEIGARRLIPLPEKADLIIRQPDANTMASAAMDRKEKQMVALGAKLIQDRNVARTATEATGDETVDNSILATITRNVNKAYRQCYRQACTDFTGESLGEDQAFELNTDFDTATLSPQLLQTLVSAMLEGRAITVEELRWLLRRSGYAYMEMTEYEKALGNDLNKAVDEKSKKASGGDRIAGNGPGEPM